MAPTVVADAHPRHRLCRPRLAALYDLLDPDRSDLDAYVAIAGEVAAHRVVDIGCGTGALAVRLAEAGHEVTAVDPAEASLEIARTKPYAERVSWVVGDATALTVRGADLVMMTGNVAQVFVSDDDWARTLDAAHACLAPRGCLVLETRRPDVRDWLTWDRPPTATALPDSTTVTVSRTVTDVTLPLVSFESITDVAGEVIASASTLRFRGRDEIEQDLAEHAFEVVDVRDAADRPGKEWVFLARRVA